MDPRLRDKVSQWPYEILRDFEGTKVLFAHYALDASSQDFKPLMKEVSGDALDRLFNRQDAALVFFGHDHRRFDLSGRARYLNPGSLGCSDRPVARYYMVDFETGGYTLEHKAVRYDDRALVTAYTERHVPDRQLIRKVFFGGRF